MIRFGTCIFVSCKSSAARKFELEVSKFWKTPKYLHQSSFKWQKYLHQRTKRKSPFQTGFQPVVCQIFKSSQKCQVAKIKFWQQIVSKEAKFMKNYQIWQFWLQQNLIFQQAIRIPTVFSILKFIVICALTKNTIIQKNYNFSILEV